MTFLLHAITASRLTDPPRGLRGGALAYLATGSIGVWMSAAVADAGTRDDAFDHHRIVEELCARQPCLPIRFGTRVEDAQGAALLLEPREQELADALLRVGGRREVAVTLLWLGSGARPGRGHGPSPEAPGRAFLERKRVGYESEDLRRATATALADRLVAGLAADQADVRHVLCPSSEIALSTAILAPAGEADALKEKVMRVASELDGVRAVVSGPWPPYTFASAT